MVFLLFEVLLIPVSILNLLLLILLVVIVHKYLRTSTNIEMYKSNKTALIIIKYSALFIVCLKYIF